jgi:hypothetical protein
MVVFRQPVDYESGPIGLNDRRGAGDLFRRSVREWVEVCCYSSLCGQVKLVALRILSVLDRHYVSVVDGGNIMNRGHNEVARYLSLAHVWKSAKVEYQQDCIRKSG